MKLKYFQISPFVHLSLSAFLLQSLCLLLSLSLSNSLIVSTLCSVDTLGMVITSWTSDAPRLRGLWLNFLIWPSAPSLLYSWQICSGCVGVQWTQEVMNVGVFVPSYTAESKKGRIPLSCRDYGCRQRTARWVYSNLIKKRSEESNWTHLLHLTWWTVAAWVREEFI